MADYTEEQRDKPHHKYSGPNSQAFWERIRRIPWAQGGEAAYCLGCALQDHEERVLFWIEQWEGKRDALKGLRQSGEVGPLAERKEG